MAGRGRFLLVTAFKVCQIVAYHITHLIKHLRRRTLVLQELVNAAALKPSGQSGIVADSRERRWLSGLFFALALDGGRADSAQDKNVALEEPSAGLVGPVALELNFDTRLRRI